jgi:hypothetical protein
MYHKKKYEMNEKPKDKGKDPRKIYFEEDLADEYQIMKTFLVIFNIFYKGDTKNKDRIYNRDKMDDFLHFFLSKKIIGTKGRY